MDHVLRRYYTPRAGLCVLGAKLQALRFFEPLEHQVQVRQKVVKHRPLNGYHGGRRGGAPGSV